MLPMLGTAIPRNATSPTNFYVSTTGSDTGDGSASSPWATADHARAVIRPLLASMTSDIIVNISPGDYWSTALAFTDADSPQTPYRVVYQCSGSVGTARLNGGVVIDPASWVLYSGSIYRTPLPGASGALTTMWENGVRSYACRTPAYVPEASYPMARRPYKTATGVNGSQTVLQYGAGDISPGGWDLASAQIAAWTSGGAISWLEDVIPVQSVNTGASQVTLTVPTFGAIFSGSGSRYFAQATSAGDISGPGQFFHDTSAGYLYYWPVTSPIASQQIVIPTTDRTVAFVGSSTSARTQNITLDGLTVQFSKAVRTFQADNTGASSAARVNGLVFLNNTTSIRLSRMNVCNAGLSGIYYHVSNHDCTIENTDIHHTGLFGLYFDYNTYISGVTDIGDVLTGNISRNFRIRNTGELYTHGSCLYAINASNCLFDHFELHDSGRAGIELRGDLLAYATDNIFRYGKLHNLVQDSNDMGGIYTAELANKANKWDQITIDTVTNGGLVGGLDAKGFYTDINGGNQKISNVNATNIQSSAYFDHSGSSGNTLTNAFPGVGLAADIGLTADFPY